MQRLFPQTVSSDQHLLAALVVQGEGKHTSQLVDTITAHFLIQMGNHLGVGVGREPMAPAPELGTELRKVVNFPIEYNPDGSILVKHWLVASSQIDDAKAAHPKARAIFYENAFVIRTAMHDGLAHAVNCGRFNSLTGSRAYDARNSTHALSSHPYVGIGAPADRN
jgi:hypothetical protein